MRRAAGYLLAFILAQVIGGGVAAVLATNVFGVGSYEDVATDLVSTAGITTLLAVEAVVAIVALALVQSGPGLRAVGLRATRLENLLATRAIAPVTALVVTPVVLLRGDAALVDPKLGASTAALLVAFALLVGFAEELFFRGLVLDALGGASRPWLAAGGSSLLFGLPHVLPNGAGAQDAALLNAAGVTLAIGVPFALVRMRATALWPLVVAHGLIDAAAFLHTASVAATGSPSAGDVAGTLLAAGAVAGGYALWYRRRPLPEEAPAGG